MYHFSSTTGERPITFRHFARKNYALFAALGREVQIGVLSVATLSTAAPALAASHTGGAGMDCASCHNHDDMTVIGDTIAADPIDDILLNEATAVASRAPMTAKVAARTVMTFSREDIAAAGVTSLNDLVKLCAGVDVRQRGAFGVQTDISIDGGTFDQITILVNGINVSSPHTGHLSADVPVTAQDIERIEVLEGAAARIFGTSAFTGAINIVTRREAREVNVHAYGGMYGYAGGEARLSLGDSSKALGHLSGGYTRSDGATPNSDFQSARAFLQGEIRQSWGTLDYQAGYSNKPYGANTFYGASSTDQWERNERWMTAMRLNAHTGRLHLQPAFYYNRWNDHYQWHKGSPAGENFHKVDVYGLTLNSWVDWTTGSVQHKTAFGIEVRNEGIRSSKLGDPLPADNHVPETDSEEARYTHAANRTNISGFLEHNILLSHWTLSAGLLANLNTALDARWRFYPGVDIAYRPDSHWGLFASWNMALRMPTFTDLYYSGTGIEGTRNLRPEHTNDLSIKVAWSTRSITADASLFYSHKTDMIDWVVAAPDPARPEAGDADPDDPKTWTYRSGNFTLDNLGIRAGAAWMPRQLWGTQFPLRRLGVQFCHINEDLSYPTPILASKYAQEYVRNKVVVNADTRLFGIRHAGELDLNLSYRYCDRVANESYGLVDARLAWESQHYSLYVDAHNLLDATYHDFTFIRQPGIWVVAGARVRF